MEDILHLCRDVFPWLGKLATLLGRDTQDNRFAHLGGELFILAKHIPYSDQAGIDSKLFKVAELVNKACSITAQVSRNKHVGENGLLDALQRILECMDSNTPAERSLVRDIRRSLTQFVQQNLDTQHLEYARLRLSPEHGTHDDENIPFELLFVASTTSYHTINCQYRWREAKISVARKNDPPRKKQVSFTIQSSSPSPATQSKSLLPNGLRKVEIGGFCRLIDSEKNKPIHFYIQNNVMKFNDTVQENIWRDFLPQPGIPLAEWLEQTVHLSNRVKVTLAYTIARSVWQYYNSYWMVNPWTHENIQMLKENISDRNQIRPHPYFTTKLDKCKQQILDYCSADDLFHMYPNVLALGVILVEIAAKKPLRPDSPHYLWDETTINEYYEWAWTTASCSDLGKTIGAAYKAVVNNCLDPEIFRECSIDLSKPEKGLEIRQSLLYEKVVLPLRELYHAYKDDWEIEEIPGSEIPISSNIFRTDEHNARFTPANRSQFKVAIFCALPLEADAVRELFEEVWGEEGENYGKAVGDDNTYTLGKIQHHNVVLVHMADMGKGAASQAASSVRSSYPEVKLGLVVGICGGVPNDDLILGDVVISDGIVQYDLGRQLPDTFLTRAGPYQPNRKIQGMLAKLKGLRVRERVETKLSKNLKILQNKPGLKRACYPGIDKDELFQSTYRHKHQDPASCTICGACVGKTDPVCEEARKLTCQQLGCQRGSLVPRQRLMEAAAESSSPNPKIYFGLVGSGDTVMKSGQHRNETAAQHNLIAFEMEASGVCGNLPCLVIKGVCDYADSHKNKHWQDYAAATAAACMKAILEEHEWQES
ncbi:hypothetical protein ZTR_06457 [Talaromyces verruculosus]|nr:hypothetical protein ZTR_06457 [Talaromyces verruculosus]